MGKHTLSFRKCAALHLFGHEWVWSLRACPILGHHLLALDICSSCCHLHWIGTPGLGRFLAGASSTGSPAGSTACAVSGRISSYRDRKRCLVLLQCSRSQRIPYGESATR